MADELFAEVKSEGNALDIDKAFDRLETKGEAPAESRTAKEGEAVVEGENTPVETPKDSQRWAQMRREIKEAKEAAASAKAEAEALKNASTKTEPPAWWKKQYGDTPEAAERFQQVIQKEGELDWIKQSILSEIDNRTQAEQAQTKEGEEYVDAQLQELTDEGAKFDRNTLLKFMVDFQEEFGANSLLDAEGNYDFKKSLALMERLQPQEAEDNETRKQLASQASRSKSSTPKASTIPVVSRRDLRRGWRDAGI